MPDDARKSRAGWVILAWLVVALPLGWGLYRSLGNSLPLFTSAGAAEAPAKR